MPMTFLPRWCDLRVNDLSTPTLIDVDHFPCGCLVTTHDARIVFANQYFNEKLEWDIASLVGRRLDHILTKPTQLFCESYIIPTVLNEGQCCEVQVSLLKSGGASIQKVTSVRRMPNGNLAWIFLEAENRNRLFHELETARLALQEQREKLELLAVTDPLTGLANRRGFENDGRQVLVRARRSGRPVSALMLDVDLFKILNDTYGHDAGDKALCILAGILKSSCGDGDSVARMGGDEFACLLVDTDLGGAKLLCERIHGALGKDAGHPFTVSIGIAELADDDETDLYEFLKRADDALYAVKLERTNRATYHPERSVGS